MSVESSGCLVEDSHPRTRFSILALDGGGARGYLSAKILEHVEAYLDAVTGQTLPLGARFDLIAGSSTGGIIALALSLGLAARDVSALYESHIPLIFGPAMRRRPAWTGYIRPRYRADALRRALHDFFGERTLGDVQTDVCVTAVSLVNAQPRIFRSDYFKSGMARNDEKLADLALATSAAPTFFEAHSTKHFTDLVDGGLCASNPTLVGVVEAFRFSRPSRRGVAPPHDLGAACLNRLSVLSVGAGEQCSMPYDLETLRRAGTLAWGAHFHNVSIECQAQLVHILAKGLIGGAYRRINPRLDFPMALDDARKAVALKNLAELSEDDEAFLRAHLAQPCTV